MIFSACQYVKTPPRQFDRLQKKEQRKRNKDGGFRFDLGMIVNKKYYNGTDLLDRMTGKIIRPAPAEIEYRNMRSVPGMLFGRGATGGGARISHFG